MDNLYWILRILVVYIRKKLVFSIKLYQLRTNCILIRSYELQNYIHVHLIVTRRVSIFAKVIQVRTETSRMTNWQLYLYVFEKKNNLITRWMKCYNYAQSFIKTMHLISFVCMFFWNCISNISINYYDKKTSWFKYTL